ncbi:MAG: TfoX/Sxy family protein [Rhodothermales bacterium]|nr:TfoX/Sxy family protein [Rhodothermales bacterium]
MAYDEGLADRLRGIFADGNDVQEKKMFGGLAVMVNGHMCCGIVGDELMVRVGPALYEEALSRPHARPMDFTGRPSKGMVYVGADGFASSESLRAWVDLAMDFVDTLPPR